MKDPEQDNAGVPFPPPLVYVGALIVSLVLNSWFPLPLFPGKKKTGMGLAAIGLAVGLFSSAFGRIRQAGTNISPMQPTTALIVEGPYRFTRNPIYLAMTLLYSGLTMLANSLWGALLLPVVLRTINREVIDREEAYLERKFGEEYREYKKKVKRWL